MRGSLIRIVLTVVAVAVVSLAWAQDEGFTAAEQAEIAAAATAAPAPGVIGDPVPHPDAWDAPEATIFFSDFEADNGGLVGSLDWEWGTYAWAGTCGTSYPPAAAYSGSNMWGTVLNECYNNLGNNGGYSTCVSTDPTDDSIVTLTVDLTGYTDAQLSWWEWLDVYMNFDWAEVYVNGDVVFQHCGTGYVIPTAWVQQVVDLTPYVGGLAIVEFHMLSSTVVERAGWYIDDLEVSGTPVPVELQSLTVE